MENSEFLQPFTQEDLEEFHAPRAGETRFGATIELPESNPENLSSALQRASAPFVLIGIPEDIGPRANCGRGGADGAWEATLSKLLNIQDQDTLHGNQLLLLGRVKTGDLLDDAESLNNARPSELEKLRQLTDELDQRVTSVIRKIVASGKTAIIIGGGHNNCYGALKGSALGLRDRQELGKDKGLNCINLDPHADLRQKEGRHSGNGFTYAIEDGSLQKYAMVGLHKNYNSDHILRKIQDQPEQYQVSWFDDFLRDQNEFNTALDQAIDFCREGPTGIELDLDCIAGMPVSAETPSGLSVEQARSYLQKTAEHINHIPYLHLAEGAPEHDPDGKNLVGKTITYLISDFLRRRTSTA